jgi:hypothetical protein
LDSAAAESITLNVEPGGSVSCVARLSSGESASLSSFWYAAAAALVSWLTSGFGLKVGIETMAWIAPVRGSIAIAAPLVTPRWLLLSSFQAASWALVLSDSTTFPPPVLLPVNMSFTRSAKSVSLSPERKSFSAFSMPTAPMLTGRYPTTAA